MATRDLRPRCRRCFPASKRLSQAAPAARQQPSADGRPAAAAAATPHQVSLLHAGIHPQRRVLKEGGTRGHAPAQHAACMNAGRQRTAATEARAALTASTVGTRHSHHTCSLRHPRLLVAAPQQARSYPHLLPASLAHPPRCSPPPSRQEVVVGVLGVDAGLKGVPLQTTPTQGPQVGLVLKGSRGAVVGPTELAGLHWRQGGAHTYAAAATNGYRTGQGRTGQGRLQRRPHRLTSMLSCSCASGSASCAATLSCHSTRSCPVMASLTGCSTCSRVFISLAVVCARVEVGDVSRESLVKKR